MIHNHPVVLNTQCIAECRILLFQQNRFFSWDLLYSCCIMHDHAYILMWSAALYLRICTIMTIIIHRCICSIQLYRFYFFFSVVTALLLILYRYDLLVLYRQCAFSVFRCIYFCKQQQYITSDAVTAKTHFCYYYISLRKNIPWERQLSLAFHSYTLYILYKCVSYE